MLRPGGSVVSVAEEPPKDASAPADVDRIYFVVEPKREQLLELGALAERGVLTAAVDQVFELEEARAAFEHNQARGKRGKVVFRTAA